METKRILIVDDEEPIRHVASQAVVRSGWQADAAADAAAALSLVKDHLYDAAVIDFNLPDMDGVRLHSEIRRVDPELAERTLFISALDQSDAQMQYYEGAGGFLPKPFDVGDLVKRLREMLGD